MRACQCGLDDFPPEGLHVLGPISRANVHEPGILSDLGVFSYGAPLWEVVVL
jgi:hypothetical protein